MGTPGFNIILGRALYIEDEAGWLNIVNVCEFIRAFLKKFRPDEQIVFSWAEYCDKKRPGHFTGGAGRIDASGYFFDDAISLLSRC